MTQTTVEQRKINYAMFTLRLRIRQIALSIAVQPQTEQPAALGLLVAELERAGVVVPEAWACALDEV